MRAPLEASRVIAVDGPGGSGKSTIARMVARKLGWTHLDTGAYYRAATLAVLEAGESPDDVIGVLSALRGRTFSQEGGAMMLDGVDVSDGIRTPEVDEAVSPVSAHPEVRAEMVATQRAWVASHGGRAVVEGRDIGTVVFPQAQLKVFLTAEPEERARRRALQTGTTGSAVATELERRDHYDTTRTASPLTAADDAHVIDTTELAPEEVVDQVLRLYRQTEGSPASSPGVDP